MDLASDSDQTHRAASPSVDLKIFRTESSPRKMLQLSPVLGAQPEPQVVVVECACPEEVKSVSRETIVRRILGGEVSDLCTPCFDHASRTIARHLESFSAGPPRKPKVQLREPNRGLLRVVQGCPRPPVSASFGILDPSTPRLVFRLGEDSRWKRLSFSSPAATAAASAGVAMTIT